jgi:hypothetical protein
MRIWKLYTGLYGDVNSRPTKYDYHFHPQKRRQKNGESSTSATKKADAEDDVNIEIAGDKLNQIAMAGLRGYKCKLQGHLARGCKVPTKDKKIGFSKGKFNQNRSLSKEKRSLYYTAEGLRDDYPSNYGMLNPSDSDDVLRVLNFMVTPTWHDDDDCSSADNASEFHGNDAQTLPITLEPTGSRLHVEYRPQTGPLLEGSPYLTSHRRTSPDGGCHRQRQAKTRGNASPGWKSHGELQSTRNVRYFVASHSLFRMR